MLLPPRCLPRDRCRRTLRACYSHGSKETSAPAASTITCIGMQALPIFLDRLADPITAVLLSITIVLIFGVSLSGPSRLRFRSTRRAHEYLQKERTGLN